MPSLLPMFPESHWNCTWLKQPARQGAHTPRCMMESFSLPEKGAASWTEPVERPWDRGHGHVSVGLSWEWRAEAALAPKGRGA